jgi:hypothetical protein
VVYETISGSWRWATADAAKEGNTATLAEGQRLALGLPAQDGPRLVYADGQEVRAGDVYRGTCTDDEWTVRAVEKRGAALVGGALENAEWLAKHCRLLRRASAPWPTAPQPWGTPVTTAARPVVTTAIVAETEQARRVRQFGEFRAAVETACPAGCRVIVDRLHPVTGRASYGDALVILTSGKRATECPFWDYDGRWVSEEDVTPECWIRETVESWDREAGEAVRREGGR